MGQPQRDIADHLLSIQDARWQRGERPLIADLVQEFGSPVSSETVLDLIDNELVLRETHGATIDLQALIAQFPQLAREIRIQFELHSLFDVVDSLDSIARQSSSAVETVRIGDGVSTDTPVDSIHRDVPVPIPATEQPWEGDSVPPTVGGCSLIRILGTGGMGAVYEGFDPVLQRVVAIKVIRPSLARSDAIRARFLREARAVASLQHDNIAAVYRAGEDQGILFLVMPRMDGETLADRLKKVRMLGIADCLRLATDVAEGLRAAHQRGMLHRDIKPANLWLEPGGRVRILDFGLARTANDASLTRSGEVLGTPAYMSPEQAERGSSVPQSDLFSLGCVLFHALTGVSPFLRTTVLATLRAVADDSPPDVRTQRPETPSALAELVTDLLEKDLARRPRSADDVLKRLRDISPRDHAESPRAAGQQNSVPPGGRLSKRLALWGAGGLLLATAVWLVVKDRNGRELSRHTFEPGMQVELQNAGTPLREPPSEPEPGPANPPEVPNDAFPPTGWEITSRMPENPNGQNAEREVDPDMYERFFFPERVLMRIGPRGTGSMFFLGRSIPAGSDFAWSCRLKAHGSTHLLVRYTNQPQSRLNHDECDRLSISIHPDGGWLVEHMPPERMQAEKLAKRVPLAFGRWNAAAEVKLGVLIRGSVVRVYLNEQLTAAARNPLPPAVGTDRDLRVEFVPDGPITAEDWRSVSMTEWTVWEPPPSD